MRNRDTKNEIVTAINDYVSSSSDVYERIFKINNPDTYIDVVKVLKVNDDEFVEEVKDVWFSMKKDYFAW